MGGGYICEDIYVGGYINVGGYMCRRIRQCGRIYLYECKRIFTSIFTGRIHRCHPGTLLTTCTFLHCKEDETCQCKLIIRLHDILVYTVVNTDFLCIG